MKRAPLPALLLAIGAAIGPLLCSGCWSTHAIPDSESPYDNLPAEARRRFDVARQEQDAGNLDAAREALAELAREHPGNVPVAIWLQEAEITAAGASGPTDAAKLDPLRAEYKKRAEEKPDVVRLLLAARLEPDRAAATDLIGRARKIDDACAWCPYALAWLAARASDWPEVRSQLERAHKTDPGHMPTRWFEVWMLARAGGGAEALDALESWLDKARGDWRLDQSQIRSAEVDHALLALLGGSPGDAKKILADADPRGVEPGKIEMVVAAIREAGDDPRGALRAAEEAEKLRPGDLLPVVQQALLHEFWLREPDAAEAAWTRVLALSRANPELGSLLERMRARVRLERLQAARGGP